MIYPKQDIEELGDLYIKHLEAMTTEGLHSKSDIAAQLAMRDKEIEELKEQVKLAEDFGMKFGIMKESGKKPYMTFDIRPDSELDKLDKLQLEAINAEIEKNIADRKRVENFTGIHTNIE